MTEDEVKALLRDAKVVHLQPDDAIVVRFSDDRILTPDVGQRLAEAFHPRDVVVFTSSVGLGYTDGTTHWAL